MIVHKADWLLHVLPVLSDLVAANAWVFVFDHSNHAYGEVRDDQHTQTQSGQAAQSRILCVIATYV